ncbi:asparagine synthase (glutamine-hydrolyzing) [Chelatococcus sambhunathii]|uniref:asparagine synthase (glutamine-hydrolyzing) n=1 Tax=Chelatococcus sambhunathii TaxID=363953 RepID=A0ABU1DAW2_9HYPH|nr:asparagine synthase (glutamine-hydrolyzing) [Chelatococcus sambhunathii]MDR4305207.1 asparagine synthase (glutamine-hydrolyzing) [Chelatococcus sambhunathii]
MCGIFFHAFRDTPAPAETYTRALSRQHERGPDHQAVETHAGFVVGHTRLSIIDVSSAGDQPFWDSSRRYALTYNGELYNHVELRGELERGGATFATRSDTEVLLEALIRWGVEAALPRLRGMFAFVLHDTATGETIAARDHFGQKPLYWSNGPRGLVVASDPLAVADVLGARQPDLASYALYLATTGETGTRGMHHPDRSFFAGVAMLPAGHLLRRKNGATTVSRYFGPWNLFDPARHEALGRASAGDLLDELLALLDQSVRRHLVADVPLGVLLSGGIDSSLLFWLAQARDGGLQTFTKLSPGIETIPLDVVPKLLQKRSATAHLITQDKADFVAELEAFVGYSRAPSRWNSGPSMLSLCRSARRNGVIALIGGDCADEVFGGYIHYRDYFARNPALEHLGDLVGATPGPAVESYLAGQRKIRREILDRLAPITDVAERQAQATLIHDQTTFLQTCVLPHSDAYSMMASVELRTPMLDLDLVGFAANLPMRWKAAEHANGEYGKRLMRALAEREIGGFTNVKKEGTRNYAMAMAEPSFWRPELFEAAALVGAGAPTSKKDLLRRINLEMFHNAFFAAERRPIGELMTGEGRAAFRVEGGGEAKAAAE